MGKILTCSEDMKHEYCASVVKIGELFPIKNSDNLVQTYVNGCSIVVRKDEVKEGDVLLYAPIETQLNDEFLSVNNMYELHEFENNSNAADVAKLLVQADALKGKHENALKNQDEGYDGHYLTESEEITTQAKAMCGYFTHTRRIRIIKLRGCPSMGFLFHLESLAKWCPAVADINLEELVGEDFDTVDGKLFIKVYVPNVQSRSGRGGGGGNKKASEEKQRIAEMLQGNWLVHYETSQLGKNMFRFTPETEVVISTKIHGSLGQYGYIQVKKPYDFGYNWFNKLYRFVVPKKWQKFTNEYEHVYGSHKVVKNQDINPTTGGGYYGADIWEKYHNLLAPYISKDMVVYGEIFGYVDEEKGIQGEYDYGCAKGTNKYMPYRIYTNNNDGTRYEWEITDVYDWTVNLIKQHPELKEHLFPLDILYKGTLGDLYPDVDRETHWQENILLKIQNEKKFFMEMKEPLCKNKVYREGIVIRILKDPVAEAFKSKTVRFKEWERGQVDAGIVDMEMADNYGNSDAE